MVLVCLVPYFFSFGETVNPDSIVGIGEVTDENRLRGSHTFSPLAIPHTFYAYCMGTTLGPSINEMHKSLTFDTFRPHLPLMVVGTGLFAILALAGLIHSRRRASLTAIPAKAERVFACSAKAPC